jgi:hypothetical protein
MRTEDVRRWVSERAAGIVRLILAGEPLQEDAEGAIEVGDIDYAAYVARELVLYVLSVASLCAGGEVDLDESQTTFDWFEGVDRARVDQAAALALEVTGRVPAADWLDRLSTFVSDGEALLGLDAPIPRLRASDEMFASLALTRDWLDLCAELGGPVVAIASGGQPG